VTTGGRANSSPDGVVATRRVASAMKPASMSACVATVLTVQKKVLFIGPPGPAGGTVLAQSTPGVGAACDDSSVTSVSVTFPFRTSW
jgi:hypothetical protein